MKLPCIVDTENWYWNRQLQLMLFSRGIGWAFLGKHLFSCRTRRYLVIQEGAISNYISWCTHEFAEENPEGFYEYTAKEILGVKNGRYGLLGARAASKPV